MLDSFAESKNAVWEDKRYGFVARCRVKSAEIILLKPSTYMNLSGNAVRYWLQQEKIPVENMLVLVDDLNLHLNMYSKQRIICLSAKTVTSNSLFL